MKNTPHNTSWQKVAPWYNKLVGTQGHYYHEHVVLPRVLRLLDLKPSNSLADLGCGQGILAKHIPQISRYLGIDAAVDLLDSAQKTTQNKNYKFLLKDLTKPLPKQSELFSHAALVLSLQNMSDAEVVISNAASLLQQNGVLAIVLNHPCFRIPRQSGWGVAENTRLQYRWINRYQTAQKIPISMHPGKQSHATTWSFHHSLGDYWSMLKKAGFILTDLEEWYSDKESVGKAAKMENRARSEFPLFLAIKAVKK